MRRHLIMACAGIAALAGTALSDTASAAPAPATSTAAATVTTATPATDITPVQWHGGGRHHGGWGGGHGGHGGYGGRGYGGYRGFYGPRFYGPAIGFYASGPRCWWSHRWHRRVCRYY